MRIYTHCNDAIEKCMKTHRFAIAHLSGDERAKGMHIHDCLELYYSIAGDKQFVVEDRLYDAHGGDLFIVNPYETHRPVCIEAAGHERMIICIHPDYLPGLSTADTDLAACFYRRDQKFSHRVSLSATQRLMFESLIKKCTTPQGFGSDLLENTRFTELMVMVSGLYMSAHNAQGLDEIDSEDARIAEILGYINERVCEPITIDALADAFFLSKSYLCRIFKQATGTTINRYLIARRISIAKRLLAQGRSVHEACELCGFGDYTHFIRTFGQAVGMSPKQYALSFHTVNITTA